MECLSVLERMQQQPRVQQTMMIIHQRTACGQMHCRYFVIYLQNDFFLNRYTNSKINKLIFVYIHMYICKYNADIFIHTFIQSHIANVSR